MGIQNENRNLDAYLTHYYKLPFERTAERFRRRKLLETLALLQPQSILEVGCGLNSIFADIDESVCGTIIEPISALLERQRHLQPRCKMHQSILEQIDPQLVTTHDCVLLSSLIHEVDDPKELIEKSLEWLKPKGTIICIVPNGLSIHRFIGLHKGILDSQISRTATQNEMQQRQEVFTPETLSEMMGEFSLKTKSLTTFFPKIFGHAQMQDLLDRDVIDEQFLEQMYELSDHVSPAGSEILYVGEKS